MDDKDSTLHGHELVELQSYLVVGGFSRNGTSVRNLHIDVLESVSEVRDDGFTVLVIDVDGDNLSPSEGFD